MIRKTPEHLWAQLDEMFADPRVMLREAMDKLHSLDHSFIQKSWPPLWTLRPSWMLIRMGTISAIQAAQGREAQLYQERKGLSWQQLRQAEGLPH